MAKTPTPKYDPKLQYVVAPGQAITSLAGIRSEGMEVSEKMFAAGKASQKPKPRPRQKRKPKRRPRQKPRTSNQ